MLTSEWNSQHDDALIVCDESDRIIELNEKAKTLFKSGAIPKLGDFVINAFPMLESLYPFPKQHISNKVVIFEHKEQLIHYKLNMQHIEIQGKRFNFFMVSNKPYYIKNAEPITATDKHLLTAQRLSKIGTWEWHVQSDKLFWSTEMHRLWETPLNSTATYKIFFDKLHPDDQDLVQEHVEKALKGHQFNMEYRIVTNLGNVLYIHAEGEVTFDENGQPVVLTGTAQDITLSKKHILKMEQYKTLLEHQVNEKDSQIQESKALSQAKSQFLANISHELRTPLHGILASLELLQKSNLTSSQQKFADISKQSAENFLTLINEILDFSKLEANKTELEFIDFDLNVMISDVLQNFTSTVNEQAIILSCDIDDNVPNWLHTDRQKLKQILLNLISNAIKFSPGDQASFAEIKLSIKYDNGLHFCVTDNGIGIKPEKMNYLFQPFTQADASTSRMYGGTGLGLPIVKGMVELLKGNISCQSDMGKGTQFCFTVPVKIKDIPEIPFEALSQYNIVLVGEQNTRLKRLKTVLKKFKLNVVHYSVDNAENLYFERTVVVIDQQELGLIKHDEHSHLFHLSSTLSLDTSQIPTNNHILHTTPFFAHGLVYEMNQILHSQLIAPTIATQLNTVKQANKPAAILVVEDNENNQEVIQYQLKNLGFDCDIASDGIQAIQVLQKKAFDLIITDCHMPNMDGYALTQYVRHEQTQFDVEIPIIGLTGDISDDGLQRCKSSGMNDVIYKPARMEIIAKKIAELTFHNQHENNNTVQEETNIYATTPILDVEVAKQYIGNNDEYIDKFTTSFITKHQNTISVLQQMAKEKDDKKVKGICHQVKTAALYVGALKMHAIARDIEQYCKDNTATSLANAYQLVEQLVAEFTLFVEAVDQANAQKVKVNNG